MTQQRWLVTGCAGFIGSHLIENLLTLGHEVIGIDDMSTGSVTNLDCVRQSVGAQLFGNFMFIQHNIIQPVSTIGCDKVDIVAHLAGAFSGGDRHIIETNCLGIQTAIELSESLKADRLIYASSAAVYGNSPLPHSECGKCIPNSPYGSSKYFSELLANASTVKSIGVRLFNVYGKRQKSGVIPKWINAIVNRHPIMLDGCGSQTRDFIHVDDVVRSIVNLGSITLDVIHETINLGTGVETELQTVAELISEETGIDYLVSVTGQSPGIIRSKADTSKMSMYGLSSSVSVHEGIKRLARLASDSAS